MDRIRSETAEFLRRFTIEAYYEKGHDRSGRQFREMVSNWNGSLLPEVGQEFHKSDEWCQFEAELLAVAESQAAQNSQPNSPLKLAPKVNGGGAKRLPATIESPMAARRMEAYMESKGIHQSEFGVQLGTTERTLRKFRQTGKVRRDIFDAIAKAMGTTREALLKPE